MTYTNKPMLSKAICGECGHEWMAFCPEGYNDEAKLECPSCHKFAGDFE